MNELLELEIKKDVKACKGQMFKAKIENYIDSAGRVIYKEVLIPQKRKSCTNKMCNRCIPMLDKMKEEISSMNIKINGDQIDDGQFYKLTWISTGKDYESSEEDWELEFHQYEEGS